MDGSCNNKLKIKGFCPGELTIGDWTRSVSGSEEVAGHRSSEKEIIILSTSCRMSSFRR